MSYATVEDMTESFAARDLVQLTNEDPSATTVDAGKLQKQLSDATLIIDTYIESRFALPFEEKKVPPILGILCRDLAMYRLQSLRPLHDVEDARKRHDDALKMLREIADGKLTLGLNKDGAEPAIASPTVLTTTAGGSAGINLTGGIDCAGGQQKDLESSSNPPNLSHVFDRFTLRGF